MDCDFGAFRLNQEQSLEFLLAQNSEDKHFRINHEFGLSSLPSPD